MKRSDTGDGDHCPLNPNHGQMMFLQGSDRQWCPHQSHDGAGKVAPTRNTWPQGVDSFRRAVIAATLPEIDVALIGG